MPLLLGQRLRGPRCACRRLAAPQRPGRTMALGSTAIHASESLGHAGNSGGNQVKAQQHLAGHLDGGWDGAPGYSVRRASRSDKQRPKSGGPWSSVLDTSRRRPRRQDASWLVGTRHEGRAVTTGRGVACERSVKAVQARRRSVSGGQGPCSPVRTRGAADWRARARGKGWTSFLSFSQRGRASLGNGTSAAH